MTTLTKSWLQQQIAEMESARDEIPFGLGVDGDNTIAAFKLALSSLGSEPIHQVLYDTDWCDVTSSQYDDHVVHGSPVRIVYTAPPAPVVPDEQHVQALATEIMKRVDKVTGERHSAATLSTMRLSVVEACRGAMLQAGILINEDTMPTEPVSEPYKLADGWIKCSERMPEANSFVLVSNGVWVGVGKYDSSEHLGEDEHWQDEHCEFIDLLHIGTVNHWMPLPVAPLWEQQ